jgi:CheY-like chemotaxis protein
MKIENLRVLIVEDENIHQEFITESLNDLGIRYLSIANSVAEAKLKIANAIEKFHFIISDYNMPGQHGGELLRYLYSIEYGVPFVFFTNSIQFEFLPEDHMFLGVLHKSEMIELENLLKKLPILNSK